MTTDLSIAAIVEILARTEAPFAAAVRHPDATEVDVTGAVCDCMHIRVSVTAKKWKLAS